jgi:hypothetical protein
MNIVIVVFCAIFTVIYENYFTCSSPWMRFDSAETVWFGSLSAKTKCERRLFVVHCLAVTPTAGELLLAATNLFVL